MRLPTAAAFLARSPASADARIKRLPSSSVVLRREPIWVNPIAATIARPSASAPNATPRRTASFWLASRRMYHA